MYDFYARRVEEQNEDLKTDKLRDDLKVSLTDMEYSNLKLSAYKAGFESAGELLSSFVGDLTGWQSNGSDERQLADDWYERAFGMNERYSNFRYFLYNYNYYIEDMVVMLEDDDIFEAVYQDYIGENGNMINESKEECIITLKKIIELGEEL